MLSRETASKHGDYLDTENRQKLREYLTALDIDIDHLQQPLDAGYIRFLSQKTGVSEPVVRYQTDRKFRDELLDKNALRGYRKKENGSENDLPDWGYVEEAAEDYFGRKPHELSFEEITVCTQAAREGELFENVVRTVFYRMYLSGPGIDTEKEDRWVKYSDGSVNRFGNTGFEADFVVPAFGAAVGKKEFWSELGEKVTGELGQDKFFIDTKLRSESYGVKATVQKYLHEGSPTKHIIILYAAGREPEKKMVSAADFGIEGADGKSVIFMKVDELFGMMDRAGMTGIKDSIVDFQRKLNQNEDYEPVEGFLRPTFVPVDRKREDYRKSRLNWEEAEKQDRADYLAWILNSDHSGSDEILRNEKELKKLLSDLCETELGITVKLVLERHDKSYAEDLKDWLKSGFSIIYDTAKRFTGYDPGSEKTLKEISKDVLNKSVTPVVSNYATIKRLRKATHDEIKDWIKELLEEGSMTPSDEGMLDKSTAEVCESLSRGILMNQPKDMSPSLERYVNAITLKNAIRFADDKGLIFSKSEKATEAFHNLRRIWYSERTGDSFHIGDRETGPLNAERVYMSLKALEKLKKKELRLLKDFIETTISNHTRALNILEQKGMPSCMETDSTIFDFGREHYENLQLPAYSKIIEMTERAIEIKNGHKNDSELAQYETPAETLEREYETVTEIMPEKLPEEIRAGEITGFVREKIREIVKTGKEVDKNIFSHLLDIMNRGMRERYTRRELNKEIRLIQAKSAPEPLAKA